MDHKTSPDEELSAISQSISLAKLQRMPLHELPLPRTLMFGIHLPFDTPPTMKNSLSLVFQKSRGILGSMTYLANFDLHHCQ
jgi:hypothetical protein